MSCPIGRCALPEDILQIDPCASFYQEPHDFLMTTQGSLVQRCRMGMETDRVVPVWIFARVKQQSNDLHMTELRCRGKRAMAIFFVRN